MSPGAVCGRQLLPPQSTSPPAVAAAAASACLQKFSECAFISLLNPFRFPMAPNSKSDAQVSHSIIFFRFALLTSIQGNALISARVVNSKNRDVPSFAGTKEWMDKFASIKKAIPVHCFEHSYFTSFRYLFVDIAVSAALFYAVSFLEQMPFHPAMSALLYCPFIAILLLRIFCPAFSLLDAVTPRIGCVRAAFSLDCGCSLTSAATAGSALVTW